ncbi:IS3 family transposase, partial [Staphylococcus pseudintermedius]|nr:IS3 family transposase [Staphylococcus pseudintermedius]
GDAHLCQRPEIIYKFIYEHRHEFRVVKMHQVLGVSRSSDDWKNRKPSARVVKREGLKKHIYQIYIKSQKRYGSPKITQLLRRHGHTVTQRTVSRLIKALV